MAAEQEEKNFADKKLTKSQLEQVSKEIEQPGLALNQVESKTKAKEVDLYKDDPNA